MGLLASCPNFIAVPELNVLHYGGAWYEIARVEGSDGARARPPERNVAVQYDVKQRGFTVYIEATRHSLVLGTPYSSTALLMPDRRYCPTLDGNTLTVPGYFVLEYTGRAGGATREYIVALLDAEYRYALVLDPGDRSAVVLAREKTLRKSQWNAVRNEIARQLCIADVEHRIRWTAHDGVETAVVADEVELCTFYM